MSELIHPNGSYTAAQVALLVFGKRNTDWFYRRRQRLLKEECFPHPISKIGQPRWSGAALLHWMSAPRVTAAAGGPELSNVLDIRTERMRRQKASKSERRRA